MSVLIVFNSNTHDAADFPSSANDVKHKQATSKKEHTVQPKPLPLPPYAEIQLELQEQEMLKLERFGKILAGPNTNLGIDYS